MKKRFVTLFGYAENVELVKMTGMIPFKMYQKYGYISSIVVYRTNEKFTYHKDVVKGLRLIKIKDEGRKFGFDVGLLKFLIKHAKNIDVLHRFHYSLQTLIYVIIYKILNPRGIAYITLDNDLGSLKEFPKSLLLKHPKNFIRNIIAYNIIEPLFLKLVDIMSSETSIGTEILKGIYRNYSDKFYYQPYGIDEYFIKQEGIRVKNFDEKENIILTSARVGVPQKNHEMLLRAIEMLNLRDWKVIIAGKIVNKEFENFVEEFFSKNPHLREKIIFTGHITDRNALYDLYNRSKIFVMTSNFESFGIVMVEAGYFKNYLLTTDVISAKDITDNGRCGDVVPIGDVRLFAEKLQFALDNPDYVKEKAERLHKHVIENFLWDKIIDKLYEKITNIQLRRK